ncbi:MAG TPA: hypothetical protein VFI03_02285 [Solirubrobacterales bacterium]|nr:hypothetical protein [Solirubrobacterales bacterium]
MTRRGFLADERGTTLTELMVGLATGTVVMLGLTTLVMLTMHTTTRVSARVDSTQRARLSLNRIVDQLHSACIAPKVPPIRKESTSTELRFIHATGASVSPTPTLSVVRLSGTSLMQSDYAWKEGTAPYWVFQPTPIKTTLVMDHVSPISVTKPIFSYYASAAGAASEIGLPTPLSELDASRTIHVGIAYMAHPRSGPGSEDATPTRIRGGATFRLTAVSYNEAAPSMPCQ